MGESSVELVRRVYDAWNTRGLPALAPELADGVAPHDPPEMPDTGSWHGRPSVLARLEEVATAVGGRRVEVHAIRPCGDEVLVTMTWQHETPTGEAGLGSVCHLVRVDEGRIARIRVFLREADALAASSRKLESDEEGSA